MVSPEAKAIQALANELDSLFQQSAIINDDIAALHKLYLSKVADMSKQHQVLLTKMAAIEEAINKLQLKTPKLYHEDA